MSFNRGTRWDPVKTASDMILPSWNLSASVGRSQVGRGMAKGVSFFNCLGPQSSKQRKIVLCMLPRASKQCRKEGHSAPSSSCKVKLPSEQYLISVPAVLSTSWLAQLVVTTLGGRQAPDAPPRPMP